MNSGEKVPEERPEDEEVPIGREKISKSEGDTTEFPDPEKLKKIHNLDELCLYMIQEGYGQEAQGIYEAGVGLKKLIKDKKSDEDLGYTLERIFQENEDLFKWLNYKSLKNKAIGLLMKDIEKSH